MIIVLYPSTNKIYIMAENLYLLQFILLNLATYLLYSHIIFPKKSITNLLSTSANAIRKILLFLA